MKMILAGLALAFLAHGVTAEDPFFLISTSVPGSNTGGRIYRMEPGTYDSRAITSPGSLYRPIAVDYDTKEKKIYWSEVGSFRRIRRANLDGSKMETVFYKPRSLIDGLAVDSVNRLVFYTDSLRNVTGQLDMEKGFAEQTVISTGLEKPRAIVLDTAKKVMYWTDWGQAPKIERANYDGSSRRTLVSSGLKFINALALDDARENLYWLDAGTDIIETSDTNGKGRKTIVKVPYLHHFFGMAFYQGALYVTDWEAAGSNTNTSRLYKVTLSGTVSAKARMGYGRMNDIHAYSGGAVLRGGWTVTALLVLMAPGIMG